MNKRDFIKFGATALLASSAFAAKPNKKIKIVIAGGGFGGLTVAKYLKLFNPSLDVTVIDRSHTVMTCPFSNLWLADLIQKDSIVFDKRIAAKKYGYRLLIDEITQIEQNKIKTIKTSVDFDYLVIAGGIDYDYKAFGIQSQEKASELLKLYPPALIAASERERLRNGLDNMKNQTFVMNVPSGVYRCPPGPYERACMIAYKFKNEGCGNKIILIDPRQKPASKPNGFLSAFNELYKNELEYIPSASIKNIDIAQKQLTYDFFDSKTNDYLQKTINFDFANFIPQNRANSIVEMSGIKTSKDGWAELKTPTFQSVSNENIYIVGDSISSPYPKSAQMANSMGIICAKQIALKALGSSEEIDLLPSNICFSYVNGSPKEAIVVAHSARLEDNQIKLTPSEVVKREEFLASAANDWYKNLTTDIFK